MKKSNTRVALFCFAIMLLCINYRAIAGGQKESATTKVSNEEQIIINKIKLEVLEKKIEDQNAAIDKNSKVLEDKLQVQKDNLDYQKEQVAWWLNILGIILAIFGIGIPVIGFIYGRKMYHDLEKQKKEADDLFEKIKESLANKKKEAAERVEHVKDCEAEADRILDELSQKAKEPNLTNEQKKSASDQAKDIEKTSEVAPFERDIANALDLYFSDKYEEALSKHLILLQTYPDKITLEMLFDIYFRMGYLYYKLNKNAESIKYYKICNELKPLDYFVWGNLGVSYDDNKEFEEAIMCYKKALEINPLYVDAWYNLGVAYFNNKMYNEAIESYKKAIEIKPDYYNAINNIGVTFIQMKLYGDAINKLIEALNVESNNFELIYNLGLAYYLSDDIPSAIKYYKKALNINPNYHKALVQLGNIYTLKLEYDEAIKLYIEALRQDKSETDYYTDLIEILIFCHRMQEAKIYINEVMPILGSKDFNLFLLQVLHSLIEDTWTKDVRNTFEELKELAIEKPKESIWSFDEMKIWLSSDKSKFLKQAQREFITKLIGLIEDWRNDNKGISNNIL